MPKATLQFNLNDEFEKAAHTRAIKADNAYRALFELMAHFRSVRKYSELPEQELSSYRDMEDKFYSILAENNVDVFEEYK